MDGTKSVAKELAQQTAGVFEEDKSKLDSSVQRPGLGQCRHLDRRGSGSGIREAAECGN